MSVSHLLEDFGAYARGTPVALTDVSLEEQRLEAFEKGYQAGWDDSARAANEEHRTISADFAQTLKDLSFTYHEAQIAILNGLKPLMDQIMSTVLPSLVHQALCAQISELLHELAQEHSDQPIEIVTAPLNIPALEAMLQEQDTPPVSLVEEDSLAEGQAYLRFGSQEREIDLKAVHTAIEQAVTGYFDQTEREIA